MEKLSTIQKRENLNTVFVLDEKGNGGANHRYSIVNREIEDGGYKEYALIQFQNGARKLEDSIHGVLDTDLLEIVRHRLSCFQQGPFSTRENAVALTHIEQALLWMNKRVEDRIERNVLGTNNK
ncbi:MAG: ABC transporter ATPase [Clostridiaceae bacterium]